MSNIFVGKDKKAKSARKWLVGLLEEMEVAITFTKKDGTERILYCTLHEDCIPETKPENEKESETALSVYDIDNFGWRSFRWDSIKKVEFNIGENDA